MAEEKLVCATCGDPIEKDPNYEDTYWCEACQHFVSVKIKEKSPCSLCHGTGKMPGYHDVSEFYPEDPKPMKCPNCGGELTEEKMEERWESLDVKVPEHTFKHGNVVLTTYVIRDLKSGYTTHICPHCHCIVLRCEE